MFRSQTPIVLLTLLAFSCTSQVEDDSLEDADSALAGAMTPLADTWVRSGSSENTRNGGSSYLSVDGKDSGGAAREAYLRFGSFDSTGVTKVTLRLYAESSASSGGQLYLVPQNEWSEGNTNWKTKPALGRKLASLGSIRSGSWLEVDVTSALVGGAPASFGVMPAGSDEARFASREDTKHRPMLVVSAGSSSPTDAGTPPPSQDAGTPPPSPEPPPSGPVVSGSLFVSPGGSDTASGSESSPMRTVSHGIAALKSGQTLYLRGGEYVETVSQTPPSRSTVQNFPGERPVIRGLVRFTNAQNVTLDGVNVTWNTSSGSGDHMVKMSGGSGWKIQNCEFWGAHSYAALLISAGAHDFYVGYNKIHDTFKSNDSNQDHLIYANQCNNGIIERNLFWNSLNGRALKVGSLTDATSMPSNLTIRYNTMYNNMGPSNLQFSYAASRNRAYRNILVKSGAQNVTAFNLSGSDNQVTENVGFQSSAVVETGVSGMSSSANRYLDPKLANPTGGDFHPQSADVTGYGRYAP